MVQGRVINIVLKKGYICIIIYIPNLPKMNRFVLSPVLLLFFIQLTAQTELAVFNFESGLPDSLQEASTLAPEVQSAVANYFNIDELTNTSTSMGAGCPSGPNNAQSYGQLKWNFVSANAARNAGRYFFISLNLKPTSPDLVVSSIQFNYRSINGGPTKAAIEYSLDGSNSTVLNPAQNLSSGAGCFTFVDDINQEITNSIVIKIIPFLGSSTGEIFLDNIVLTTLTPLPVSLVDFSGKAVKGQGVQLDWSTATETNNLKFVVERSRDAREFDAIGETPGAGTSLVFQNYNYIDARPLPGINYYRLRQEDFDGSATHSPTIAINYQDKKNPWVLLPSTDKTSYDLYLDAPATEKGTVVLYNPLGQVLYTAALEPGMDRLNIPVQSKLKGSGFITLELAGNITSFQVFAE